MVIRHILLVTTPKEKANTMTTTDFIIHLFCMVDDEMLDVQKHSQAKLYPSETVTIGLLYALKGGSFRGFYRWLTRDYSDLFGRIPERTRLQRSLRVHKQWCDRFLAEPTLFTVVDSYGIELLHPVREKRSRTPLGKKGVSNRRWIVGLKLCWLLNNRGEVVAWDWQTANVHDQHFRHLAHQFDGQTITLSDNGFRKRGESPRNLKFCGAKTWPERMIVETAFSIVTRICGLKKLSRRVPKYAETHLAYVSALFNLLLKLGRTSPDDSSMQIAQFSL